MESPQHEMLQEIESLLKAMVQSSPDDLSEINRAMSYSLLSGGKRLRALIPLMVLEAHSKDWRRALFPACALECIHTYSLIHDDLPCMDNDDFRRGIPTNHKAFGEAVALLAGDALLTLAFELIAQGQKNGDYSAEIACQLVLLLSKASGRFGMIGGQLLDMKATENRTIDRLQRMHRLKTGALLESAFSMGALLSTESERARSQWLEVGRSFGILYQIQDDLLDVTGNSELLGKPTGSDAKLNKWTYIECFGIPETQGLLEEKFLHLQNLLNQIPAQKAEFQNMFLRLKDRNQ